MKKSLIFVLILIPTLSSAYPRLRGVSIDTIANATLADVNTTIDRFCYEFQSNPDELFKWAYLNTDQPPGTPKPVEKEKDAKKFDEGKDGKDAIRLVYKDRTYNAEKHEGDVAIDIYVLGTRLFRDNHFGTYYTLQHGKPGHVTHQLDATYSGSLLDGGIIRFQVDSIAPQQTRIRYTFNLTLGRFLAAFVSDKTWQNVGKWRFEVIFNNLVEYAETGKVIDKSK